MDAGQFITRLDGVRSTGRDQWIARCPSHDDKSPSLAIKQIDDRILLHDFAGCSTYEIVSVLGLELSDLFPEKINPGNKRYTKPFPANDILKCLSLETMFIYICAKDLLNGEKLTEQDVDRLRLANERIHQAVQTGDLN